jgi:hypothetical protein
VKKEIALAMLIIAGGCKKMDTYGRRGNGTAISPPVAASAPQRAVAVTDSGPVASLTCGVSRATRLTDAGIGELKPGRPVAEVKRLCNVTSDSRQRGAEGQPERVVVVEIGPEVIPAVVVDDKIWRIAVTTSRFITTDSLGVDTPLTRIAHMRGAQFAPGEDGVYGFVAAHCALSFRFSLPLRPPAGGEWTVAAIDRDHGDAVVDRVLVRKCGS